MRKLVILLSCATVLVATGVLTAPAGAAVRYSSCQSIRISKFNPTVRHIYTAGAPCRIADGVIRAYDAAITLVTKGNTSHQGACYPSAAYGLCGNVIYHGVVYSCFHFTAVPKRTRGLVRCVGNGTWKYRHVAFNIGF